jgi:hypothetical protein
MRDMYMLRDDRGNRGRVCSIGLLVSRVLRDIRFEANISEYEAKFYSLGSEYNSFYSLVSHRSESADFTCETNKNGSEYFFLREYFQKELNVN